MTSRDEVVRDAAAFGMIGLLAQGPGVPHGSFGDDEAHGADAVAARGSMWDRAPGEAFGASGLGLTGIGEGGGRDGGGVGLGHIGTLGHTDGLGGSGRGGDGSRLTGGAGWARWGGHWVGWRRTYTCEGDVVSGRLPAETIQRIVRQNFGRFRACYSAALVHDPALAGTVTTRFVIGRDGSVSNVGSAGSSLADPSVAACVVRAFYGISFPQPEGGIVTVTYPIAFSPD